MTALRDSRETTKFSPPPDAFLAHPYRNWRQERRTCSVLVNVWCVYWYLGLYPISLEECHTRYTINYTHQIKAAGRGEK
jgi:hypothetical protein